MTLDEFIDRIDGFVDKKASEQIPYFGYFLITYQGQASFTAKDIDSCFLQIRLPAYSNISAFLSKEQKAKRLLKAKVGYILSKKMSDAIANDIGEIKVKAPSDNLFPIDIFDNTRDYVKKTARQAILCYDYGLYDGCLVMIRRLIETLIIELFEHRELKERILDKNNNYVNCHTTRRPYHVQRKSQQTKQCRNCRPDYHRGSLSSCPQFRGHCPQNPPD